MKAHSILILVVIGLVVIDLVGIPIYNALTMDLPSYHGDGAKLEEFRYWSNLQGYHFGQSGVYFYLVLILGGNLLIAIVNWARRHPA